MSVPVYERIVHLLEAEGIDTLFGIPDPGFMHMAMTAEKRGWKVVAPHHEQAGGFMADAWSRMTGKPGVWDAGPRYYESRRRHDRGGQGKFANHLLWWTTLAHRVPTFTPGPDPVHGPGL